MSFVYLPSAKAIRGTLGDVSIAIDFRAWSDGGGNRFGLICTQLVDAGQNLWDYWGNQPINGVQPPGQHANAGQIWSCATDSLTPYKSPAMSAVVTDQLVNIMNAQQGAMWTDWIQTINDLAAALTGAAPPPPTPGTFATWQDGATFLSGLLTGYQFVNGQVVPKA